MSDSEHRGEQPEDDGLGDEQPEMWSRERVVTGWAQLWNVPNLLTLLRILLIPVFWILLMFEDGQNSATRLAATFIFVFAAYTDWLDGHLARKEGLVTTFGKIADPLADKALTGAALIGLSMLGELWWWVTLVILARELGVTLIRFVVLKHGVIPASRGGKLKTLFQMGGIVLYLLPVTQDMSVLWWARVLVMGMAVVLTVVTGVDYVAKAVRTRSDSKAARAERDARRAAWLRQRGRAGSAGAAGAGSAGMAAAGGPASQEAGEAGGDDAQAAFPPADPGPASGDSGPRT